VVDNADLIIMGEAMHLIIAARLANAIDALADFCGCNGKICRRWLRHPFSAGTVTHDRRQAGATLWAQDLGALDLEAPVEYRIESLRFRGVKGTTGTQASVYDAARWQ
jgi:adenylosuccinate lyase